MKNYIITGAGRGVGFETVKYILENTSDVTIYAVSRNVAALQALGRDARLHIIAADITTDNTIIAQRLKGVQLHGILNNAGILVKKEFTELTYSDFESVYKTNVYAPFDLTVKLLPLLAPGAHILNIGSMGGYQNTSKFPGMVFYSSSKAALQCLSQCMAEELRGKNVVVNSLSMGAVETEMVKMAFPGFEPPINAPKMASFFAWFLQNGQNFFNGQIIPLALNAV